MKIGAFEINEPLPELHEPHALAMLRPWVDVGNVGSLVLSGFETHFKAKELGKLVRPGNFFDFTRYRPTMHLKEGKRQIVIPNSLVSYAKRTTGNDFIFLHLLEPHMFGETYVDSVLRLLKQLGVKRYYLLGSMYDFVPHTRPLIVTGGGIGKVAEKELKQAGIQPSDYQGPTTITYLISQRAPKLGIETVTLMVHVPQYSQLDEDYMGQVRLMEVLGSLYGLPVDEVVVHQAEQQRKYIDHAVDSDAQVKEIVTQLEAHYDSRMTGMEKKEMPQLSPQIEKFLKEMERLFRRD